MSTFLLKRKNYSVLEKVAKSKAVDKLANQVNKNKFLRNAKTFGYDLIDLGKENKVGNKALKMVGSGAIMAGTGYLVDKAITHDRKKLGIPVEKREIEETEESKKKKKAKKVKNSILAGLGATGLAGGTLLLARHGKLNKDTFKKAVKNLDLKSIKPGKGELVLSAAIPLALSGVPYLISRKQLKDQAKQTRNQKEDISEEENEKTYSAKTNEKSKSIGKALKNFFIVPKEDREKLAKQMSKKGDWMKKMSKVVNPKNKVLGAAVGFAALPLVFKPWEIGEKATKSAIKKLDKNAYAYEESQDEVVET